MGTNYYAEQTGCSECGHTPEPLHIGKSSAGWAFTLHVIPEMGLNCLMDWIQYMIRPDITIRDEYGRTITSTQMRDVISKRDFEHRADLQWHSTVGHGEGSWDLVTGDFS